ncbi:L-rhamnose mutarotase [Novosphingobium sp. PhB55]|nr:L-rhamnose mutarotase [Novosphingobium sp. PhB55]
MPDTGTGSIHAFRMQLKPGTVEEYRRRHDAIWPELSALLTDAGIRDYSIFLDEDSLSLFAVLRVTPDNSRETLPDHPVMRRWWDYMAPLMEVEPGNRPVEWPLPLLFHMD